jgi:predicted AAA+ superfamily ATPase
VPLFDYSIRRQLNSPKKIYLIDQAFHLVGGLNFSPNSGRILENIVFIELKRRYKEIFYFREKNECDFVIKDNTKIKEVIQVCYNLTRGNKDREVKGLIEAMDKFKLKKGFILTYDQEEKIIKDNKKIIVKPVWKWLLNL